jgi:hypothetical protein
MMIGTACWSKNIRGCWDLPTKQNYAEPMNSAVLRKIMEDLIHSIPMATNPGPSKEIN